MPQYNERQSRLEVISEIGDARPRLPSTRNMAVLLRERGIRVSHVTIAKDYKELAGRPARTVQSVN
jgi:DNA-binding transcriptional regulator YhcF (GntR family)